MKKLNTEIFIARAQKVHGNLYDYSKVIYEHSQKKIVIVCKKHGEFLQLPTNHLISRGCLKCAEAARSGKYAKSVDKFISDARKVHGNLYDYSKVVYINNKKNVLLTCRIHGSFLQAPHNHTKGKGCALCGRGVLRKNTEEFIINARMVHGDLYDYSKVDYVGNKKKVIIICKIHGQFLQKPNSHLTGSGCPICKCSKGEKLVAQTLENLGIKYQREFSFSDLSGNINPLRFDFALFKNNKLSCLIEYDGELHFRYVKGFHRGIETFKLHKKYDKLKNKYCKKNNIKLIRISYKCKDIEKYLKEHLN